MKETHYDAKWMIKSRSSDSRMSPIPNRQIQVESKLKLVIFFPIVRTLSQLIELGGRSGDAAADPARQSRKLCPREDHLLLLLVPDGARGDRGKGCTARARGVNYREEFLGAIAAARMRRDERHDDAEREKRERMKEC